jgi:hypothetical protein
METLARRIWRLWVMRGCPRQRLHRNGSVGTLQPTSRNPDAWVQRSHTRQADRLPPLGIRSALQFLVAVRGVVTMRQRVLISRVRPRELGRDA